MELAIIIILGGVILAASVITFIIKWRQTHIAWKPLLNKPGMFYCFEGDGSTEALSRAIDAAVQALVDFTKWTRADINKAISDLHVHVKKDEHWVENTGDARGDFKTAGLQMDNGVRVGPSLAALCHEIAHRVGQVIDHNQYINHEGWAEMGIYAAIEEYLAHVKK